MTTTINVAQAQRAHAAAHAIWLRRPSPESEADVRNAKDAIDAAKAAEEAAAAERRARAADEFARQQGLANTDECLRRIVADHAVRIGLLAQLAAHDAAAAAHLAAHQDAHDRANAIAAEHGFRTALGQRVDQSLARAVCLHDDANAGRTVYATRRDLYNAISGELNGGCPMYHAFDALGEAAIRAAIDGTLSAKMRAVQAAQEAEGERQRMAREAAQTAARAAERAEMARKGQHYFGRRPRGQSHDA